ncbi:hypothetical protein J3F84DRAFT_390391 [Trichoderma pleuroticola]
MCLVLVPVALSGAAVRLSSFKPRDTVYLGWLLVWLGIGGDDDDRVHWIGLVARAHKGPVAFTQVLCGRGFLDSPSEDRIASSSLLCLGVRGQVVKDRSGDV